MIKLENKVTYYPDKNIMIVNLCAPAVYGVLIETLRRTLKPYFVVEFCDDTETYRIWTRAVFSKSKESEAAQMVDAIRDDLITKLRYLHYGNYDTNFYESENVEYIQL